MNMHLLKFKAFFAGSVRQVISIDFASSCVTMEGGSASVEDCQIMQFTGQWDVEGSEIYTGMIVQSPLGDSYIVRQSEDGQFVLEELCYGHYTPINELCLFEFKIVGHAFGDE